MSAPKLIQFVGAKEPCWRKAAAAAVGESNPATSPVGLKVHDVLMGEAQPRAVTDNLQCSVAFCTKMWKLPLSSPLRQCGLQEIDRNRQEKNQTLGHQLGFVDISQCHRGSFERLAWQ